MEGIGVSLSINPMTFVITVLNLVLAGVGIYVIILAIKALKIYINNNENKDDK